VSDGAVLGLVAVTLAVLLAALFRLVAALDSAELTLRRLVAGMWSARRTVQAATELAATVERDAARGRAELDRLQSLKRPRPAGDGSGNGGAGPVSLPFRPGPSR
jgi:HAMP domain-containing protein